MRIRLPFPPDRCWPNKRGQNKHAQRADEAKAKLWGGLAAREALPSLWLPPKQAKITITVHPKPRGPAPDEDNCIAALKHSLDGIALILGMNDRDFRLQPINYGPRCKGGAVIVEVE